MYIYISPQIYISRQMQITFQVVYTNEDGTRYIHSLQYLINDSENRGQTEPDTWEKKMDVVDTPENVYILSKWDECMPCGCCYSETETATDLFTDEEQALRALYNTNDSHGVMSTVTHHISHYALQDGVYIRGVRYSTRNISQNIDQVRKLLRCNNKTVAWPWQDASEFSEWHDIYKRENIAAMEAIHNELQAELDKMRARGELRSDPYITQRLKELNSKK